METLAYFHCASAYEEVTPIESLASENDRPLFQGLNWKKLSNGVCLSLVPLAMALSFFSVPEQAQARTLKYGKRGHDVVYLQKRLKRSGYLSYGVRSTGFYGRYTRSAVKSLQRSCGLKVDGIVGRKTKSCLNYHLYH